MPRTPKRIQKKLKINLSEHTLNVNTRKGSLEMFRFSEIEDYVRQLTGKRQYQFDAIKEVMIYLWGGGYKSIEDLAHENWPKKPQIRDRFGSEEIYHGHFPLRDRLSGVVHMATGTGKSFVMFAIAYLSVVMGLTKRALVLGPSSTIIEQGLREKFELKMRDPKLNELLPKQYQHRAINLLTDNEAIEDDSIIIENINAVFTFGSIQDTFFRGVDEVLVLSDEVHHAYSHLKFNATANTFEEEQVSDGAKETDENAERLWMQFLLGKGRYNKPEYFRADGRHKITRHIGFTGTPYNVDDYFADVIFDYSIRTAITEQFIKDINPLLRTQDAEGEEVQWTDEKKFEVVLRNHLENKNKYSYVRDGKPQVKPITVFICPNRGHAEKSTENFIRFLRKWEREENGNTGTDSEIEDKIRDKKVICVISGIDESKYKSQLDRIEETDETKVGGSVEFVFAVNKLSEGWDVENVFQIVPMEERVFNSKLLISQVLGRGLRIPRNVTHADILQTYPLVTITNHEKFAKHIEELMEAVVQSDMHIASEPLAIVHPTVQIPDLGRTKHHFTVFNLNYLSATKLVDTEDGGQEKSQSRTLKLTTQDLAEPVTIEYLKDKKEFIFKKKTTTIDRVVDDIYRRLKTREWEGIHFDFGSGDQDRCPTEGEIREVITNAMGKTGITGNQLSEENRQQIELYFNQFLPRGKKQREFVNVLGDLVPISSTTLERSTVRLGELERDVSVFLSEDYSQELDQKSKLVIEHLQEEREKTEEEKRQAALFNIDPKDYLGKHKEYARSLVDKDPRPPFVINTSVLKSPQSAVIVTHSPEKEFVFELLGHAKYIDSWIKSPDKSFYSLDYEYWKGGKDRMRRSFNPDFFIKIDLVKYISLVKGKGLQSDYDALVALQDRGIEQIIKVVEIKSDEDDDDATPAKAEWGAEHFKKLNGKLQESNITDIPKEFRKDFHQYYTFDLLTPRQFYGWFEAIELGGIVKAE